MIRLAPHPCPPFAGQGHAVLLLLVLSSTFVSPAFAAPLCPASVAELGAALDEAQAAFGRLDAAGMHYGINDAAAEIACLRGPIPPVVAARLHRLSALRAFVDGDESAARRALFAARVLDPSGEIPPSLLPADHPLRALDPGPTNTRPASMTVPAPPIGTLYFDGHASLERPADRPTAMQVVDAQGKTLQGGYFWPEMPIGAWSTARVASSAKEPTNAAPPAEAVVPTEKQPRRDDNNGTRSGGRLTRPLLITSGVSFVLAGAAYTASALATNQIESQYESGGTPASDPYYNRQRVLFPVAVGLGGAGLVAGLGAAATWVW